MSMFFNSTHGQGGSRQQVRLLVLDDVCEETEVLLEVAEFYHPDFEFSCKVTPDPVEAMEAVKDWEPSVVMIDLHAVKNALQILTQIANFGSPVVAIGEKMIPGLERKVRECGGRSYLAKTSNVEGVEDILQLVGSLARGTELRH